MAVSTTVSDSGKKVQISVGGNFDFQLYNEFRTSYADTNGEGTQYIGDLSGSNYLDSSALGMLHLLREHAGGDAASIEIKQTSPEVKNPPDGANFGKLFDL